MAAAPAPVKIFAMHGSSTILLALGIIYSSLMSRLVALESIGRIALCLDQIFTLESSARPSVENRVCYFEAFRWALQTEDNDMIQDLVNLGRKHSSLIIGGIIEAVLEDEVDVLNSLCWSASNLDHVDISSFVPYVATIIDDSSPGHRGQDPSILKMELMSRLLSLDLNLEMLQLASKINFEAPGKFSKAWFDVISRAITTGNYKFLYNLISEWQSFKYKMNLAYLPDIEGFEEQQEYPYHHFMILALKSGREDIIWFLASRTFVLRSFSNYPEFRESKYWTELCEIVPTLSLIDWADEDLKKRSLWKNKFIEELISDCSLQNNSNAEMVFLNSSNQIDLETYLLDTEYELYDSKINALAMAGKFDLASVFTLALNKRKYVLCWLLAISLPSMEQLHLVPDFFELDLVYLNTLIEDNPGASPIELRESSIKILIDQFSDSLEAQIALFLSPGALDSDRYINCAISSKNITIIEAAMKTKMIKPYHYSVMHASQVYKNELSMWAKKETSLVDFNGLFHCNNMEPIIFWMVSTLPSKGRRTRTEFNKLIHRFKSIGPIQFLFALDALFEIDKYEEKLLGMLSKNLHALDQMHPKNLDGIESVMDLVSGYLDAGYNDQVKIVASAISPEKWFSLVQMSFDLGDATLLSAICLQFQLNGFFLNGDNLPRIYNLMHTAYNSGRCYLNHIIFASNANHVPTFIELAAKSNHADFITGQLWRSCSVDFSTEFMVKLLNIAYSVNKELFKFFYMFCGKRNSDAMKAASRAIFLTAIRAGDVEIVSYMVQETMNLVSPSSLFEALKTEAESGHFEVIKTFLASPQAMTVDLSLMDNFLLKLAIDQEWNDLVVKLLCQRKVYEQAMGQDYARKHLPSDPMTFHQYLRYMKSKTQ